MVLDAAREAGAVSLRRVLDSAPVYDAVAAQDTVTMLAGAVRQVLAAADAGGFGEQLREVLGRGCESGAKPDCDWEDPAAREALVAELAADASAVLAAMQGRALSAEAGEAAELLAAVAGQDLEEAPDGRMRIARRVAAGRVISTVDPDGRHSRKSTAGGFDGYKGHIAVDPDSEIITDTAVTAGNAADASTATALIKDILNTDNADSDDTDTDTDTDTADSDDTDSDDTDTDDTGDAGTGSEGGGVVDVFEGRATVYGDSAYGSGEFQQLLRDERINSRCRTQVPAGRGGLYTKDRFSVDLGTDTVTCPAGISVRIRRSPDGDGTAGFAGACKGCEQRSGCTAVKNGRTISVGTHEAVLAEARQRQSDPAWKADCRATGPIVERRLAHLKRRWHGGRRA